MFPAMSGKIPNPVRVSHDFAALARSRPGTALDHGIPMLMRRDQIADRPEWTVRENHHRDFSSLYLTRHGRGVHVIDGQAFAVARGDVYVMAPGMAHHFTDVDALVFDTIHFQSSILEPGEREVLARMPGFGDLFLRGEEEGSRQPGRCVHLEPEAFARVADTWDLVQREWESGTPEGALLARTGFLRLLVELARERTSVAQPTGEITGRGALVAAALRMLEARFQQPLRIEQVAAAVFLSPDRLTEIFRQEVGRTPRDYRTHLRVRHAIRLLQESDWAIARIAVESGFADGPHLARALRRATGDSPRVVRERARGQSVGS